MTAVGESALAEGQATPLDWRAVSPGYFKAMSIPFFSGRDLTQQDGPDSPQVTVVSRDAARKLWGSRDPLGRVLRIVGSGKEYAVIGVVGDVRANALNQQPIPAIYLPAAVRGWPTMDVVVHTAVPPENALREISGVIHNMDPELPLSNMKTMEQWVSNNAAQPRLNAALVASFAILALVIAAIGTYGVLSYTVNLRTREIGVRMALGAPGGSVVQMILRQGMTVALAGIAGGVLAAFAFSKILESMVFEIQVRDPAVYAAAAFVLATAAALACYVPARRASHVDPIAALRED